MEGERRIGFFLREIHNQIKFVIHRSAPRCGQSPPTQLQAGILGYLYHHREEPVYQRDLEKEFKISRATATNTLQVMERDGFLVRKALDKDARLKRIQMTEEAYRRHAQVEERMEMVDRRMLRGMSHEEKDELYRLLGVLKKNLEEYAGELGCSGRCGPEQADCRPMACPPDAPQAPEGSGIREKDNHKKNEKQEG